MSKQASNKGALVEMTIIRGVTLTWPCQLKKMGTPINLTAAVFTTEIVDPISKLAIATMTTTVTDASQGEFTISMTSVQTYALTERKQVEWRCSYQIGSEVKHVFYGPCKVLNGSGS
jgi:hypothetical protein